jgi:hypothetical protein
VEGNSRPSIPWTTTWCCQSEKFFNFDHYFFYFFFFFFVLQSDLSSFFLFFFFWYFFQELCGVSKDAHEKLQLSVLAGEVSVYKRDRNLQIPESFDSETNWPHCAKVIGDIRDQSACGCCWAFGAAEAASDRLCIYSNGTVAVPLSAQETCFCASQDGCSGGDLNTPWSYISDAGLSVGGQNNHTGPFSDLGTCTPFSLPHCFHHGPSNTSPYPAEGTPGCPNIAQGQSPQCPTTCTNNNAKAPYSNFKTGRYGFQGSVRNFSLLWTILFILLTCI